MRSLLIIDDDRKILIDNGCGEKQDEDFFHFYFLNGDDTLNKSLEKVKVSPNEITDVIMTHLHFDHCGGGVKWNENRTDYELTFPNANYWTTNHQWEAAINPNSREAPAYPKENLLPMQKSGKLKFIEKEGELLPNVEIKIFDGHTTGHVVPIINYNGRKIAYVGDLIPVKANIISSFVSAYDLFPLTTIEEKDEFLKEAYNENFVLFFGHDLYTECCTLKKGSKGIREDKSFKLKEIEEYL
jgi:glyoxylase-like metal-dependent hydrolase (beta-lactamase superfamily II)